MSLTQATPETGQQESDLYEVHGVWVYGRRDALGRPIKIDAIDMDERKIVRIADQLQRRGYGVMRRRNPRAGKTFYVLNAVWASHGEPPEDPFEGAP